MYICINFFSVIQCTYPTTCMKKYPINVDIRISGYFIAKQTASKMEGLTAVGTIANTVFTK